MAYKPIRKNDFFDNSSFDTNSDTTSFADWVKPGIRKFDIPVKVTVFDVAAYILKRYGSMTTMKLHKLLYYCQAWSLVWDEAPLFDEEIQAWANGPVVKDLFSFHRGSYSISSISIGNESALSEPQRETVDSVCKYYAEKSAQWLINLTHMEQPWIEARKGLNPTERGNKIISLDSMAEYYSSIV